MKRILQRIWAPGNKVSVVAVTLFCALCIMALATNYSRAASNMLQSAIIAGFNSSDEVRALVVDASDYLKVNVAAGTVTITDPYSYTDGASATGIQGKAILGSDGSNLQSVKVDSSGAVQVDVESALPAGTNAIGKLAANSGVDIGDVDITSIAAGTNNIGKVDIEAALPAGTNAIGKLAANSGVDIGDVDILSIAAGTNNIGKVDIEAALPAGTNAIGKLAANDGVDIGDVDVASMADFLSAGDAIAGEKGAAILGSDGANFRLFASDADGHFQMDALSLPSLPAGTNAIGKLAANSGVDIGDVDVTSLVAAQLPAALGQAAMAASMSVVIASDQSDVPVAVKSDDSLVADGAVAGAQLARIMAGSDGANLQWLKCDANGLLEIIDSAYVQAGDAIAGAYGPVVAGSDGANFRWLKVDSDGNLQVDILAELPAGTQNIGDVDVATIAAGNNNIGDVDVASIAAGTNYIGKVRATDGTTDEVFPTATFAVGGASPQTLIAAGAGGEKHRIVKMTISADTAGLITISDGIGTFYLGANQSVQIAFDPIGRQQTTAATAITMTNAGGGNVTAAGTYLTQ